LVDAERSRRRDGTSATWVKADDRYGGARPFKALYVSTATFYTTRFRTRSQCRLSSASVMCSERRNP